MNYELRIMNYFVPLWSDNKKIENLKLKVEN